VTDRILLIEDDPRLAEMVKTYLDGAGFHVTVARKGAAGLALEKREAFDAVILDLTLPDMDGLDVCRQIRARAATPILMLTRAASRSIASSDWSSAPTITWASRSSRAS